MKRVLWYCTAVLFAVFCLICCKEFHRMRMCLSGFQKNQGRIAQNLEFVLGAVYDRPAQQVSDAKWMQHNIEALAAELMAHRDLTMQGFKDMEVAFAKEHAYIDTLGLEVDRIHNETLRHQMRTEATFRKLGKYLPEETDDSSGEPASTLP